MPMVMAASGDSSWGAADGTPIINTTVAESQDHVS